MPFYTTLPHPSSQPPPRPAGEGKDMDTDIICSFLVNVFGRGSDCKVVSLGDVSFVANVASQKD